MLVRVLPYISEQDCLALKGGTAINLFIRNMPRRLAVLKRQIHDTIIAASRNHVHQEVVESLQSLVHGFTAVAVGAPSDQEHVVAEHVDFIG